MDSTNEESIRGVIERARGQLDSADSFQLDDRSPRHTDWVCMRRVDVAALVYLADERLALLAVANGVARERDEYKSALKRASPSPAVRELVEACREVDRKERVGFAEEEDWERMAAALASVEKEIGKP